MNEQEQPRGFNPSEHLIQLKSKQGPQDYLPVQWRLVWYREQCPGGTIDTEEVEVDLDREVEGEAYTWNNETRRSEKIIKRARGYARFRAIVTDGKGGRATGTKSETAASFPDYIEKAETGSIGRALAALGYGTQFAPDLSEEHRIADAPVTHASTPVPTPLTDAATAQNVAQGLAEAPASEQQLETLKKLAVHLGEKIQRPKTYAEAKAEIMRLQTAYDAMIAKGRAS